MAEESRDYGFTRAPIDPHELELLLMVRHRLKQLGGLMRWWQRLENSEPLSDSELALDDDFTAWRHLSTTVRFAVTHAADNLRVLEGMMREDAEGPLPLVATYPLARAALEGAASALWLLAPNDPRERVIRHLRNAARELHDEASFRKFSLKLAFDQRVELEISGSVIGHEERTYKKWRRRQADQIADCARRVGIADPTQDRSFIGYGEIVAQATSATDTPGAYGEILWRQMSGLAHPSLLRATSTLHMGPRDHEGDGTVRVEMSSKVNTVASGVLLALLLLKRALGAYQLRSDQKGNRKAYGPPGHPRPG
ncbi:MULTISPECIES: hypothetical protein [Microbacterium]|uniref:CHAD domain-containing protein n=1 Tax=Microbacterium wangchenii TaxID=2541726 RepID=A0ABX5SQP1_9MICO|nr:MULTISPECIES: hypothetical protein [Microbacterium]MCK6066524.1 hypothetical protein [Microbacterium sp. EYE_512]QBR87478.1 hypothetical protein E4K62_01450 [Microbacterium wangchenii]